MTGLLGNLVHLLDLSWFSDKSIEQISTHLKKCGQICWATAAHRLLMIAGFSPQRNPWILLIIRGLCLSAHSRRPCCWSHPFGADMSPMRSANCDGAFRPFSKHNSSPVGAATSCYDAWNRLALAKTLQNPANNWALQAYIYIILYILYIYYIIYIFLGKL